MQKSTLAPLLTSLALLSSPAFAQGFLDVPEQGADEPEYGVTCGVETLTLSHEIDDFTAYLATLLSEPSESGILDNEADQSLIRNHWSNSVPLRNELLEALGAVCSPAIIWGETKEQELEAHEACISGIREEFETLAEVVELYEITEGADAAYYGVARSTFQAAFGQSIDRLYEVCGEEETPTAEVLEEGLTLEQ